MLTISTVYRKLKERLEKSNAEFNQSQIIRMRHIESARQAGEVFIELRDLLKDATKNNPVLTDMGTYTSFKNFLEINGINNKTAYEYIKLAEGWDIIVRLGMQDADNVENIGKSMRICRTIKIIRWYEKALAAGRPEESLTLDQYWIDEEAAIAARRLANQERQVEQEDLAQQLREAHGELFLANQKLKEAETLTKKVEELRVTNQELQMTNQELQMTNQELQDSLNKLRLENFKLRNAETLVTI